MSDWMNDLKNNLNDPNKEGFEFKLGQACVITRSGYCYSSYDVMAKKFNLTNYIPNNSPEDGDMITIIIQGYHEDQVTKLYGVENSSGEQFIMHEQGIKQ
jgi:hypothetical protein